MMLLKRHLRLILVLFCAIFCLPSLHAQMDTQQAFSTLSKHGLVIRLNCNSPKIDTLESIISRGKLKEDTKRKLIRERDKTQKEFNEKNTRIMERFEDLYNYSKVYFVPDSLFKEFVAGRRKNVFVNKNNALYSESSFPDHFVFGFFDYNMKLNGLKFRHSEYKHEISDYKMIRGKFPKEVKGSGGFSGFLKTIFTLGIHWKDNLDATIKGLQEKLKQIS